MQDKTKKPARRVLKWVGWAIVALVMIGVLGQALGIPTASELRMTETAGAAVAQAVETEEITPTAEGTTDTPTVVRTPTPTHTVTITPTATYQGQLAVFATAGRVLDGAFDEIDVIEEVGVSTASESGDRWIVYLEVVVDRGGVSEETADLIRQAVYARVGSARVEISMILDDGNEAADYTWDNDDDEWRVTELMSRGLPTETPTQSGAVCPSLGATCSELTCEQAYACLAAGNRRLDRDRDGVPCESICPGGN